MKKILVPIDGSQFSDMAIDMAKEIAQGLNCRIVLLHMRECNSTSYTSNPHPLSPDLVSIHEKECYAKSCKILREGKAKLADFSGEVETKSIEGSVAEGIIKFAQDNDFDLIVMGSHGMSGIRAIVGSVARKVVLTVKTPTLIVK
jgi:nucleotide-binding universal stress UspA family protein